MSREDAFLAEAETRDRRSWVTSCNEFLVLLGWFDATVTGLQVLLGAGLAITVGLASDVSVLTLLGMFSIPTLSLGIFFIGIGLFAAYHWWAPDGGTV